DARVVTARGDHEGAGRRVTGEGIRSGPASRRSRNTRYERTGRLGEGVDRDRREHAERARGRYGAHVGAIDRDRRGEGPGVSLGFGNPGASLDVSVERDGDGRQDADDRDDDHQLDEGEASLVAEVEMSCVPESEHMYLPEYSNFHPDCCKDSASMAERRYTWDRRRSGGARDSE